MPSSTTTKSGPRLRQPDTGASSSDEENESQGSSGSGSASDSDSLDSSEPRKRRRTFPEPVLENDDDDEAEPAGGAKVIPSFSAPSRIKRAAVGKPGLPELPREQLYNPPAAVLAPIDPNTTFESLNVRPWLVRSLANMAIKRPTGIQKGCIPEILKGRDCIGGSRTGSGKTVAFAVPILQKWAEDPSGIFALVLTPTR
jgi:ATP-dependent RNA helicase DDX49/DBP8